MEDVEEHIVRGPEGVEVVISFLPNNKILVCVPPPQAEAQRRNQ